MNITNAEYGELLIREMLRAEKSKLRVAPPADAVEDELGLHGEIMRWLANQVPAIPYIHARTDRKSGINKGCADFTVFFHGRVIAFEVKTRTGKRSTEQVIWALLMEKQGFSVPIVRSLADFLRLMGQPEREPEA